MRHSVILVTCLDLEFLTGRDYTTIRLRHANATIRQIMTGIANDKSSAPGDSTKVRQDDILFAVMSLAKKSISTSIVSSPGTFGLFDPPFPLGLQFLNLWGQELSDHTHCLAMQDIARSRDLLAHNMGIKTPGFAEALYQFDLLESAKMLAQPWMPIPTARLDLLKEDVRLMRNETDFRERFTKAVPQIAHCRPLLDVLCDINIYCSWVQNVQDDMAPELRVKLPYQDSMRDFTMLRDTIEHRLLAYKPIGDSIEEEVCWAVSLIFTHCVIFPVPNRRPLEILLDRLRVLLPSISSDTDEIVDETFFAWVAVIGAMACAPADEDRRRFFLESVVSYTNAADVVSWSQLKSRLQRFLWLDRACDIGGRAIWEMLLSLRPDARDIQRQTHIGRHGGSSARGDEVLAWGQRYCGNCKLNTVLRKSIGTL